MVYIPSEEEVNSRGGDFKPLPEDDYIVTVKEYKVESQPNPYERTEEYPGGKPRDVLVIRMNVLSFSNGDALYDTEGDPIPEGRTPLFFDFIDVTKTGMKPQPSRFRLFMAAVFNVNIGSSIQIDSWDEILDKRFIASVIIQNKDGNLRNKVRGYKVARKRPAPKAAAQVTLPGESISKAPTEDLEAAAKAVFGDDIINSDSLPF